jgi:hypothetical protein
MAAIPPTNPTGGKCHAQVHRARLGQDDLRCIRQINGRLWPGSEAAEDGMGNNFHKIVTLFIIYGMMVHCDNFSTAAWVYLGLHGVGLWL